MRPSEDLFQLIKSLSKSEKRYFKLIASVQRGEKNYVRLFDFLEEMPEYDEDAVRKHFAGERFINQLNVTKHYLYELILKSLRAYHNDYSAKAEITDLLKSADILREKGLGEQALRMVDKAIGIAREHEEHLLLLEALRARHICIPTDTLKPPEIDARFDQLAGTIDEFRNLLDYERLTALVNNLQHNGHARSEQDYALLERCRWDPLMATPENALSHRARFLHLAVMAHYDFEHGKLGTLLPIVNEQIELLESNPALIAGRPILYLATLGNRALLFKCLGDLKAYREALAYFRIRGEALLSDNRLTSGRIRSHLFATFHRSLLVYHTMTGTFEEGAELLASLEEGLREHASHLHDCDTIRLIFTAAHLYFGRGDYRRALDFNNRILAMPEPTGAVQIYHHARLFNLLIHYELRNFDLIDYLIPSTTRYFESRGILEHFEQRVLRFFSRMLAAPVAERQAVLQKFRDELLELRDDPGSLTLFQHFQYVEWAVARIERRPFDEVIREYMELNEKHLQAA